MKADAARFVRLGFCAESNPDRSGAGDDDGESWFRPFEARLTYALSFYPLDGDIS